MLQRIQISLVDLLLNTVRLPQHKIYRLRLAMSQDMGVISQFFGPL